MRTKTVLTALIVSALLGCGSDDGMSSTPTYADISGSFSGAISSTTAGVPLAATVSVTIVEANGSVSGTYGLVGTLDQSTSIAGSGTFTGTEASGTNPSVNLTLNDNDCPSVHSTYSGSFDSANHRLTINGPLYITGTNCAVELTYSLTLVLSK